MCLHAGLQGYNCVSVRICQVEFNVKICWSSGPEESCFQARWGRYPLRRSGFGGSGHPGWHSASTRTLRDGQSFSEFFFKYRKILGRLRWIGMMSNLECCAGPCWCPARSEDQAFWKGNPTCQWLWLWRSLHPHQD